MSLSVSPPSSVSQQAGRGSMKKNPHYSPNTAKYFQRILHRRLISFHIFSEYAESSVADPWHFGVDPDLDPRIHASDQWIRILLFSSMTFKMSTKTNLFVQKFFCLLLFEGAFTSSSKIKSQKEVTKQ
jgi:hypothetical protein